jgi:ABC-type branched-subunit amino acid transport system permease subunit
VVGMEQKYGPQGMVWMDAYLANILSGAIPVLASFILVIADPGQTSRITLYLLAVVFLFLVLGVIRFLQASRAGRRFRRERH